MENNNVTAQDLKSMMEYLMSNGGGKAEIKDGKLHLIVSQAEYDLKFPTLGPNLGWNADKVVLHIGYPKFD